MDSKQFARLRKRTNLTQSQLADALGVTSRTVSAWETADPPKELSQLESRAIRNLFRGPLLENKLYDMCNEAFREIPSEMVAIWIVEEQNCILLPRATRLHDLEINLARNINAATAFAPLVLTSLTTYPLQSAQVLNLTGDNISMHPHKQYKGNRGANFLSTGICESLLHVPAFTPSGRGPRPVLIMCFQNKLDSDGKVITKPEGNMINIYSDDDVKKAKRIAENNKKELLEDMRSLEMID